MADAKPVAFLSFVNSDFQHEEGRIAQFRDRLIDEVSMHTGKEMSIFLDRDDTLWEQAWLEHVEDATDAHAFLIPFVTPRYFRSEQCKAEMAAFVDLEKRVHHQDLVLPLYYVRCPFLDDASKNTGEDIIESILNREHRFDWRELRFQPFTSPEVGKAMEDLALRINDALLDPPQPSKFVRMAMDRVAAIRKQIRPGNTLPALPPTVETKYVVSEDAEDAVVVEPGPRTRIVDPMGRADHITISEAISAADSGDQILVRPGLYQESLVIDKPVEIIGDGESSEIVVQSLGANAILLKTTKGRVSNLTLRQMHGGEWFCANATQGRLFLEECDVSSHSLACVGISSGGADPRLRRNRIHHGEQSGIIVYDNGLGTIEDNDIYCNGLSGVEVRNGGNPVLNGSRIYENKEAGVYIYDDGQGNLENNDIYLNCRAGMRFGNSALPVLRRNRINRNGIVAIWAPLKGGGDVEGNDLRGNAYGAWKISAESEPLLKRSGNLE